MRVRRSHSDYHLLVAQNFLANISRTGTHDDTNLRIFNRPGLADPVITAERSPTADPSLVRFGLHDSDEIHIPIEEPDDEFLSVSVAAQKLSAVSNQSILEDRYSQSFPSASVRPRDLHLKKASFFKRFVKIVSSDDVIGFRGDDFRQPEEIPLTSRSQHERKITGESKDSDNSEGGDRPGSPLSIVNFPFFKRLRTSLAKGERCYLCSESSGGPLAVIAHFSFAGHDHRRRLRRSRSTLANSTERVRYVSQCSIEELRPYEFPRDNTEDSVEVTFGHLLGRRRGYSPGMAQIAARRSERRESQYQESTSRLFSQDHLDVSDAKDNSFDPEKDELEWDETPPEFYDPCVFEEVESARKTVIRTTGFVGVTMHFAGNESNQRASLNEKFAEKFPKIDLTYSKFKSIKRDVALLGRECRVDVITVSQAIVYFERIVLKGLISKLNRKVVAGACLLVAVKLNDGNKELLKSTIEMCVERLRISRRELLSLELPVCAALQFDLLCPADHVMPHYHRLILETMFHFSSEIEMANFEQFYNDIKEQEKEDSVLTSVQQLDRLLRPGSTYLNLNPFEVLQIDPDTDIEAAKKKYKKLSLLIHPDKNPDDRDRADQAFDIVKKAIKQMENPIELNKCKDCYTEARARLAIVISEKRRKAKKETGEDKIEEDDPSAYKKQLWVFVTKVFADREKKRKMLEDRANEEQRVTAEAMSNAAEKRKLAEEFAKNYEESRDERSGSWRNFQAKRAKKEESGKTLRGTAFKPPKQKLFK